MSIILPKQVGTEEGRLLFNKSEEISDFKEAADIVKTLRETLDYYGGVGLAAPQIGIPKRIFIVDIKLTKRYSEKYPDMKKIGFIPYVNPKILEISDDGNKGTEGCLSVLYGSFFGQVGRFDSLKIEYFDINGEKHLDDVEDMFHSRVIQHEFDHLEGEIFLQKMKPEDFPDLLWEEKKDIRKKD